MTKNRTRLENSQKSQMTILDSITKELEFNQIGLSLINEKDFNSSTLSRQQQLAPETYKQVQLGMQSDENKMYVEQFLRQHSNKKAPSKKGSFYLSIQTMFLFGCGVVAALAAMYFLVFPMLTPNQIKISLVSFLFFVLVVAYKS